MSNMDGRTSFSFFLFFQSYQSSGEPQAKSERHNPCVYFSANTHSCSDKLKSNSWTSQVSYFLERSLGLARAPISLKACTVLLPKLLCWDFEPFCLYVILKYRLLVETFKKYLHMAAEISVSKINAEINFLLYLAGFVFF